MPGARHHLEVLMVPLILYEFAVEASPRWGAIWLEARRRPSERPSEVYQRLEVCLAAQYKLLQLQGHSFVASHEKAQGISRLKIFGTSVVFATSPNFAQALLVDFRLPLSTRDLMLQLLEKVWKEKGDVRRSGITEKRLHRILSGLMGPKFMLHASSIINDELARGILDPKNEISSHPGTAVEVYLFSFLRQLVGNIAVRAIMGLEFTTRHPEFIHHLWNLDTGVSFFLLGLENLPLAAARAGREARDAVFQATLEHHHALLSADHAEGRVYTDMSDVSDICKTLLQEWRELGISTQSCASITSAILWAANINTAPIVYWFIRHLYQSRDVLDQVRVEVEPFVQYSLDPTPRINVDIEALTSRCPLFRVAFLETLRMEAHTFSLKMVTEDCNVVPYQKSGDEQFSLKKGEIVCISHGAHQMDPKYFPEPFEFNPLRYENQPTDGQKTFPSTTYGDMFVFSGGKALCKGRDFAQAEVLAIVAAFITSWEMDPIYETTEWREFDRISTSGAYIPKKDFKIKLTRRHK